MSKTVNIVADIGGTNARFAYVYPQSDELHGIEIFPCAKFPFFIDAIRAYMDRDDIGTVNKLCFAVAGPVEADWIDLPNNHWAFSRKQIQQTLNVGVTIINDFSAQVLSVDCLQETELRWLGAARPSGAQVKAVVGPGTGLGVSAMLNTGEILPSEGGHVGFSPSNEHEMALLKILWQRYERVSVERLLSGKGLENLYWANSQLLGQARELSAPEITAGAFAGEALCVQVVNDFYNILASMAGDAALMMGAYEGVYISGGIVPKILTLLNEQRFRQRFESKGRFKDICAQIPVAIILAEHPGLLGCAQALK